MSSDERWVEALTDQRVTGHGEGQEYVLRELGTDDPRDLEWIAQAVAILKPLLPEHRAKALDVLKTFVRVYGPALAVKTQETTESPCDCGGEGNGWDGFHYPGAMGCLR